VLLLSTIREERANICQIADLHRSEILAKSPVKRHRSQILGVNLTPDIERYSLLSARRSGVSSESRKQVLCNEADSGTLINAADMRVVIGEDSPLLARFFPAQSHFPSEFRTFTPWELL
jgi:hypothetical protein